MENCDSYIFYHTVCICHGCYVFCPACVIDTRGSNHHKLQSNTKSYKLMYNRGHAWSICSLFVKFLSLIFENKITVVLLIELEAFKQNVTII